ncbi:MAG: sigma-70 family RNA polymerase sigma factor [Phycisphaerales bacterium]|nr:sigma-70 family RNA polymerase sigma factor [Phycisphaerales bacterium]
MPTPIEEQFARFVATGDPKALGAVFDHCCGELLPLAMHLTGHPADAEDALQATFVTAIEKRGEWDASRPLLPWLVGILTLHGKKLHDRRARRREVALPTPNEGAGAEPVDPADLPLDQSERRELVERLRTHVERLPDEQRSVVLLQLQHGLQPAQIAEALGLPPGTVRMRLHRGLKTLRGLLPPALVAWFVAMLPERGLAAVRQAVLQHGARAVPVAVAAGAAGGALAKWFVAAVAAAALAVGLAAWPPVAAPPIAVDRVGESAPVVVADLGAPSPADEVGTRHAVPAASAPLAAAADATELRVRVLRPDGTTVSGCIVTLEPVRGDVDLVFDAIDAATAADGVARFAVAPRAVYDVVTATARARIQAQATGPTEVELRLQQAMSLQQLQVARDARLVDRWQIAPMRVTGVVRRPDGAPASGAALCLTRHSVRTPAVKVAVAAGDGSFAFETIGMALVQAQAPGFAASEVRPCTSAPLTITLQPARGDLVGIVLDADGRPLAGARVRAIPETGRGAGLATPERRPLPFVATDRAGGFVVPDLPAGRIDVVVHADGHAPATLVLTDTSAVRDPVRVVLPRGVALRGRVVDQDGAPVAGVQVLLGGSYGIQRVTDEAGCFGFRSAPATMQALRVQGPKIVPSHVERDLAVEAGEWRVVVQRLAAYPLRLVDAMHTPLAGWWASVDGDAFAMAVQADADGRLTLPAPAVRPARVLVHRGLGDRPVAVAWPTESAPGVLGIVVVPESAPTSASLRGRVLTADGAPVDGLTVRAMNTGGRLEAHGDVRDGRFEVLDLAAGDYVLSVQTANSDAEERFPVAALAVGEARDLGDLRLPAQGQVAVRVVRPGGGAAVEPRLFFERVEGPDAVGSERFGPSADGQPCPWPVGRWRWRYLEEAGAWQCGELDVKAGELTTLDLVVPPAVRRKLRFPLPTPAWGAPQRVQYVLRGADGAIYDDGDFDPRVELPYRYAPTLAVGRWTLELTTDAGLRYRGEFQVDSLAPSLDEVVVSVQPAR